MSRESDPDGTSNFLIGFPAANFEPASELFEINTRSLREVQMQALWKEDTGSAILKHNTLKHEFPFFGFVGCEAEGTEFLLFHVNDDVVAWQFMWKRSYEPEIFHALQALMDKAKHFLDVGAYTGCYSLFAAKRGLKVDAFEIVPRTLERLKVNVSLNLLQSRIRIHAFGASDKSGVVDVHMPRPEDFLGTGNSVNQKSRVRSVASTSCRVRPLDDWWEEAGRPEIDIIKVDVEEHEVNALRGADLLIRTCRPTIIVEVERRNLPAIGQICDERNYKLELIAGLNRIMIPL